MTYVLVGLHRSFFYDIGDTQSCGFGQVVSHFLKNCIVTFSLDFFFFFFFFFYVAQIFGGGI